LAHLYGEGYTVSINLFLLVFALHFEELLMQFVQISSSVGQSSSKKQEVVKGSKLNQLQDEVVRQTSKHSSADVVTT
jgi:hypothetical protein